MTRLARRALTRIMREQAKAWPSQLSEIDESEWPPPRPGRERPRAVWRSNRYLAVVWDALSVGDTEVRRLTVNRVTMGVGGRWDDNIPWEDLQRCKRETGYGDWYAVEVYPRDRDIVNDANMRHLWLLSAPLAIGWFGADAREGL